MSQDADRNTFIHSFIHTSPSIAEEKSLGIKMGEREEGEEERGKGYSNSASVFRQSGLRRLWSLGLKLLDLRMGKH